MTYPSRVDDLPSIDSVDSTVSLFVYPLDANGRIHTTEPPQLLFSQPTPASCEVNQVIPSPNGRYLILPYDCHADSFIQLLGVGSKVVQLGILPRRYFLDWSPDGNWFLFRDVDEDQILLATADGTFQRVLNDLPFGTYRASFAPDGRHLTYAATQGLGFGSEMGSLNLTDGSLTRQQQFPHQIVAYPRWSPDGTQLVYILLPDNNTPYTIGELWLADVNGQPVTLLDEVDAGHGYPPLWSPDGRFITYIRRENPTAMLANHLAVALESNVYQVEVATGAVTRLTQFNQSLVYDPVWSPDGSQLAFTAADAVWLLNPGQPPIQVTPPGLAHHPAWITLSTTP